MPTGLEQGMTNIGFMLSPNKGWIGGVNYFRNLFLALDSVASDKIRLLVFVAPTVDANLIDEICRGIGSVRVIRTSLLDRHSPLYWAWKLCSRIFRSDSFAYLWLHKYRVRLYSHSVLASSTLVPSVNWIPDFQHVYLPGLFTAKEIRSRDESYRRMAKVSDAVILSSETALQDFQRFVPECAGKGCAARFVSQVPSVYWSLTVVDEQRLRATYDISGAYFYLPNQFWKHKNHMVVFEAISLLRQRGIKASLVCTGNIEDYRNPNYIEQVKMRASELGADIKLLGVVPYADVYKLIRFSMCVINPSLFEGWSSTVEECKSVRKHLVLSDIPVHREQAKDMAEFFSPNEPTELAFILERILSDPVKEQPSIEALKATLHARTRAYGQVCLDIYQRVLADRA